MNSIIELELLSNRELPVCGRLVDEVTLRISRKWSGWIRNIDKYLLEIYLYGVPLNYVILTALIQMCGKVELNNVQSSLLFILRFLIQLLGGIVIGMLIGNFQKVIKRGKTQSEKKQ